VKIPLAQGSLPESLLGLCIVSGNAHHHNEEDFRLEPRAFGVSKNKKERRFHGC